MKLKSNVYNLVALNRAWSDSMKEKEIYTYILFFKKKNESKPQQHTIEGSLEFLVTMELKWLRLGNKNRIKNISLISVFKSIAAFANTLWQCHTNEM